MTQDSVNKAVLLLLVAGISALFLTMISQFLMAIFLAGLFSALARPLFLYLERRFAGHRYLASIVTLLLMIFVVLIPLALIIALVVAQAIDVGQSVTPWVRNTLSEPGAFSDQLAQVPFYEELLPYRDEIMQKAGEAVSAISKLLVEGLSSFTLGTVNFIFMAFVLVYTMYFFQMDGHRLVHKILYYLPLDSHDENQMLEKFTSVTRATLKGTLLIGLLQGGLAGLAFAVAGIGNAVFWGAVMAVLSIIPSVGSALVWLPAVVILVVQGDLAAGIGLGAFCALVVGSLDNLLRPVLVGKDTQMHELMIFFGTLGGIFMFGVTGIFIGPLIASLFVTIWEIYGTAFRDMLPEVHYGSSSDTPDPAPSRPPPES